MTNLDVPVRLQLDSDTGQRDTWRVDVDGVSVTLTNLEKPYWKPEGYTKGDLLAYYYAIAPMILPYLVDRPLTMKRMPSGADGDFFYAKQAPAGTPEWVRTAPIVSRDNDKRIDYIVVDNTATLLHVANLGCIEMHPWHARVSDLGHPDYAFFDLDPFGVDFSVVRDVALLIKTVLDQLGLRGYARTSGATGMQVYVPVDRVHSAAAIRDWVGRVCRLIHRADPVHTTMEWDISKRGAKVFLDHGMNTEGRNIAATYSVRPERGAPVATPLAWDEVAADVVPEDFTMATIWPRLHELGEIFVPILEGGQDLRAAMSAVGMDPDNQSDDARHDVAPEESGDLTAYAQMRNFSLTPEPSTDGASPARSGTDARRFVIQHHLATALHHDLRLERGGTARSWALPKGLPDTPGAPHLAVQTEDHPLDYMTFEGEIPHGEYGGGAVRIWDAGDYRPIEWTDDKVTFTLTGRRHEGEWHLFRPSAREPRQWLVVRAGEPEQPPPEPPSFAPMLASEAAQPFDDDDWWYEIKWDGVRAIATLWRPAGDRDGRTRLLSRTGNDITDGYPELWPLWERLLARNAVVDGELVALGDDGTPSFQRLQRRMHVRDRTAVDRLRRRIPVTYMIFDLLAVDGEALIDLSLAARTRRLDDVLVPGGAWERSRPIAGAGTALYEAAKQKRLEGIVAKRADSTYSPGRRATTWRKVKVRRTGTAVIGGWAPTKSGIGAADGTLGSLCVGAWQDGVLKYVGRVGTGFDERERHRLADLLAPLACTSSPFDVRDDPGKDAHFVRPELVCQVEYAELTETRRLRAPSFNGLIADLDVRTVLLDDLA